MVVVWYHPYVDAIGHSPSLSNYICNYFFPFSSKMCHLTREEEVMVVPSWGR